MAGLLAELIQCRVMLLLILVLGIGIPFQLGYHMSSVTAPSRFIKAFINDTWQQRYNAKVGEETLTLVWSSIVSIVSLGGLLPSVMAGFLCRKYGKRRCQLYNNLLVIGTSLMIGFSKMAVSFEMILIGRFLYGFTAGFGITVCIGFLGEIAPMKFRGLSVTSASVFVTVGKLFGQVVGLSEMLGTEDLWPLLLSVTGITSLLQVAVFPFFPDTPPNLLLIKKDNEGCTKAMKKLWGEGDYQAEIEELKNEQNKRKDTKTMTVVQLFRDKTLRRQLGIQLILILVKQFSGIHAIYFYTYEIFQQAGFPDDRIPYISIGVGACELLGIILCSILVDRFGRKTLLLCGYGVMGIALGLLTVTLTFQSSYSWVPYCSIVLIFVYIMFYGLGPSGVTNAVTIEVFPYSARTSSYALGTGLTWGVIYITGMVFPHMVHSLQHFCFLIFLGVILIAFALIFLFLPETKGKSLTEITAEIDRIQCRPTCCYPPVKANETENIICTKL